MGIAARNRIGGVGVPIYVAALVWIINEAAAAELDFTVGPPVWYRCRRWGLDWQRNNVGRRWRRVRRPLSGGGVSLGPGIGAGGVSPFATPLLRQRVAGKQR